MVAMNGTKSVNADDAKSKRNQRGLLRYPLVLGIVLFSFWLLWSGHFTHFPEDLLLIFFGFLSCLLVVLLSRRMGIVDDEGAPVQLGLRPFFYAPWLIKEIIVANIDVTRRILSFKMPIRPTMIKIKAKQQCDLGRVIFANSITLTPGTVSIAMEDDVITVHALTHEAAADDASGEMNDRVAKLERKH